MDDNYYKKGKDLSKANQVKDQQSSNGKSRAKTQLYRNELGKGRIVESSQSGFAV